jgi:hypothetical protein
MRRRPQDDSGGGSPAFCLDHANVREPPNECGPVRDNPVFAPVGVLGPELPVDRGLRPVEPRATDASDLSEGLAARRLNATLRERISEKLDRV